MGGGTSLAAFLAACGGGGDTTTVMTNTEKESEPVEAVKSGKPVAEPKFNFDTTGRRSS